MNPLPVFTLGSDQSICKNDTITLNAGSGSEASDWFSKIKGSVLQNSHALNWKVETTDTILAKVTNTFSCITHDTVIVNMNPLPVFSLGSDQAICKNESIVMDAGSGSEVTDWFSKMKGNVLQNSQALNWKVESTDTVWAKVTNTFSCITYDTVIVNMNPLPVFSLGSDQVICKNESIVLNAGSGSEITDWFSKMKGSVLQNSHTLSWTIESTDTIWAKVMNQYSCIFYDTLKVEMLPLTPFSLGQDTSVCFGKPLILQTSSETGESRWFSGSGLINHTSATFSFAVEKTDTYQAEFMNIRGCITKDTVVVSMLSLPVIDAGTDQFICYNDSIQLTPVVTGSGPVSYRWTNINSPDDIIADPYVKPLTDTEYILKVTDSNNCINYDSLTIQVNSATTISIPSALEICFGNEVELGGNPTATGSQLPYTYSWFPSVSLDHADISNPVANSEVDTQYKVLVQAGSCKPDSAFVTVTVNPLPAITLTPDKSIGFGETTLLKASGGTTYEWTPETGLNFANIAEPEASPEQTTQYIVFVTDDKGCQNSDTVNIHVRNDLFVPNLFTPDNNGKNDVFKVYGSGVKEIHFRVFNGSGVLLYETRDVNEAITKGWDGKYKGKIQNIGAYTWWIRGKFHDGSELKFKGKNSGTVYLMR